MGGVISVVEIVLAAGMVGVGVSQIVLKAQLKDLIKPHEQEFKLMDQLYEFVDALLNQKNLVSQLNANVLFATDNWNTIMHDLEDKNDQLIKIFDKFPDIKSANFSYSFTSGLMFGISIIALGFMSYQFISGKAQTQIIKDVTTFKNFVKSSAAKIRSLAPVIKSGSINSKGGIEVTSHGTNNGNVSTETRASKTENVKAQQKKGIKSKVTTGLRVIFIAVAIYGFVQGVKGLVQLTKEIEKYEEYFKENGEFEKSKEGVIQLMNCVAADIFSLGNASRAAFYDSRITLLILSITYPKFQDHYIKLSKRLDNDKFGLDDKFIDSSKNLIDSCNKVVDSTKPSKDKLKDLEHYFRKFFDDKNPQKVFLDVSIELSKVVGEYSVIAGGIQADQGRSKRLLENVSEYFLDYRDQDFPDKSPAKKKQIDTKIMTKTFTKFKSIYEIDPGLQLQNADSEIKDILFQVIISFADDFYYDDDTGKTLFNKNIQDHKLDVNYKDMLEKELSKANVIPVRKTKDVDEQKQIEYWLDISKQQNEKEGFKYWKKEDNPKSKYRYIRLEVIDYTDPEGKLFGTLLSFEGISLSVSKNGLLNQEFFNTERNVMTGVVTIVKAIQ